jgi:hypothetical protein
MSNQIAKGYIGCRVKRRAAVAGSWMESHGGLFDQFESVNTLLYVCSPRT